MRKGVVVDVEEVISNISASLEDAERMSGIPIHHVFVGVGGTHIQSTFSKGVVAINKKVISESDINRVLEAAEAISLPQNQYRLQTLPKSFSVDDQKNIKNPVGLTGIRLEIEAHITFGQTQILENLENCIKNSGVDIDDLVPQFLAASEVVLSRRQKDLGVALVDIGSDSTSLVVFEEGEILHSCVLQIGGSHVTNDIAIGLRTSIDSAEKIKIEYGSSIPAEIKESEMIDLSMISKIDFQKISKKHLAEIIQARYHEIFSLVRNELRMINRDGMLPSGVILTGSAIKMSGIVDLAREVLKLPVQIGFPQNISGVDEKIDDPGFATAVGLVSWGSKNNSTKYNFSFGFGNFFSKMKSFFKKLLP